MFTGLIEEIGVVRSTQELEDARALVVEADRVLEDLKTGDSISVDGVCQTVVETLATAFKVQAIGTTLSRTTLGEFVAGREVNLERPLTAQARLGGHFVQGHVDGVGEVSSVIPDGEMVLVRFSLPDTVEPFTILHGSIAMDGVSLTINELPGDGTAEVALITYTYAHTNLSRLAPGSHVNLEADLLGKYVVRALAEYRSMGVGGAEETAG